MTSARVVETSVTNTHNNPSQDYTHPKISFLRWPKPQVYDFLFLKKPVNEFIQEQENKNTLSVLREDLKAVTRTIKLHYYKLQHCYL